MIRLWEYLLELLKARRQRLEMNLGLQRVFQEMLHIMDWMDEMKVGREGGGWSFKRWECEGLTEAGGNISCHSYHIGGNG